MQIERTRGVVLTGNRQRVVWRWRFLCSHCKRPGPWGAQREAWSTGIDHIELFHPAVVARMDEAPRF